MVCFDFFSVLCSRIGAKKIPRWFPNEASKTILFCVLYTGSQKTLVSDQVSEQDKSPDIPHTVLNLCIHLIAHGSESVQITHAHSIMGTANDKSYDATHDTTHDNLEDDTHQGIHQVSYQDSMPSAVILLLIKLCK